MIHRPNDLNCSTIPYDPPQKILLDLQRRVLRAFYVRRPTIKGKIAIHIYQPICSIISDPYFRHRASSLPERGNRAIRPQNKSLDRIPFRVVRPRTNFRDAGKPKPRKLRPWGGSASPAFPCPPCQTYAVRHWCRKLTLHPEEVRVGDARIYGHPSGKSCERICSAGV